MALTRQRVRLKNRLSSTLSKYGLAVGGRSDPYGPGARSQLEGLLGELPEQTRFAARTLLDLLDVVQGHIVRHEKRMASVLQESAAMRLQRSLPGFGPILSAVVVLEIGEAGRFPSAEQFASYAGTTPRVHSSGVFTPAAARHVTVSCGPT
jgi:transposase